MDPLSTPQLYIPAAVSSALRFGMYGAGVFLLAVLLNVLGQLLPRKKSEPPLVFHWIPFIGNAVSYGMKPLDFYQQCRKKHGDIFTFVLLGKKMTVYLGPDGNEFILNGRLKDVNAEEIYGALTTPVFGPDVIYDCPNSKLMEQKKFVKFGLTHDALTSYVPLIEREVVDYAGSSPAFAGLREGTLDISAAMAEITIFTAGRCLQGAEVRGKLTAEFAGLYHDLDAGFRPINFLMPWAPLPQNRRRDAAHARMSAVYLDIIARRRKSETGLAGEETDMIGHLMSCTYKNGVKVPDREIAHMMITLLMGGQHSSSSSSSWIILRLASRPDIQEELYREQVSTLGSAPLRYADIDRLPLLQNVVRETLRVNSSIHSLMRKVKNPLPVPGTDYVVTPDKVLVASPIASHMSEEHFPNAHVWDPHRWDDRTEVEDESDVVDYGYGAVSKGTKSPYLPFGAGRHRCIGEKFAYVNLCTIIATLVREFRFSTLDGGSSVPPTDYTSLFSRPAQPSVIRWHRRFPESL
ncbi:probable cytochrome P450 51 [Cephalotrichum gorgonifer]|uniref:Probable cytochrome P450 51 n=1 Tax=Cephalotrichum gorgonifer TaxID=2041049 RepID=A0AAE8MPM3_9PEZI|nr:probable cytochrome P450 51 [Cephalotrichum gorgonifer]